MERPDVYRHVNEDSFDLVGLRRKLQSYDAPLADRIMLARQAYEAIGEHKGSHVKDIQERLSSDVQSYVAERMGHDPNSREHLSTSISEAKGHIDEALGEAAIDALERIGMDVKAEREWGHSPYRTAHVLSMLDDHIGAADVASLDDSLRLLYMRRVMAPSFEQHGQTLNELYIPLDRYGASVGDVNSRFAGHLMDSYDTTLERLKPLERLKTVRAAARNLGISLGSISVADAMDFSAGALYDLHSSLDDPRAFAQQAMKHRVHPHIDFEGMHGKSLDELIDEGLEEARARAPQSSEGGDQDEIFNLIEQGRTEEAKERLSRLKEQGEDVGDIDETVDRVEQEISAYKEAQQEMVRMQSSIAQRLVEDGRESALGLVDELKAADRLPADLDSEEFLSRIEQAISEQS